MIWSLLVNVSLSLVVEFPCGRVKMDYVEAKAEFNIRLIEGKVGRRGNSPWQVRRKEFFTTNSSGSSQTALSAERLLLRC